MLGQGYGPHLILDVPAGAYVFHASELDLAQRYLEGLPQAGTGLDLSNSRLVNQGGSCRRVTCLEALGVQRVLLVTSDFHTRRALSIFKRRLPRYSYSSAASLDPNEFGAHWWNKREWAKTNFDEWLRLVWWEAVDRWR